MTDTAPTPREIALAEFERRLRFAKQTNNTAFVCAGLCIVVFIYRHAADTE
jgi:hypothetical protein